MNNINTGKLNDQQIEEKIQQRRIQILVHSYLYYMLNTSIIDDLKFDYFSKELVELQEKYPELSETVIYHKEFINFDGSSGYDLNYNQPKIVDKSYKILRYHEKLN